MAWYVRRFEPLFLLAIEAEGEAITCVRFGEPPSGAALAPPGHELLEAAVRQFEEYFARQRRRFDLPLSPRGTEFQVRVWNALLEIPYGETRSYGELALKLGLGGAARAVGAANGANPIAIVVPCHRVIGAGGRLCGYGGGLDRKKFLLDLESGASTSLISASA
ncbi:MAG TPA: methylated-DNA--[protein]-cysteine S-methyltransferase [Bryobacteraceae bacterium]|nr:methylated-DNA--[protein]-cysteine S-methyltransferase [Bryobacteraceae bacterium]